jgi:hypothetical protein
MEFKIELKDIEQLSIEKGRIITNKKGKKIEYIINNDVITEVNPYDETRIAEEKINKLLGSNDGVKKINTLMRMTDRVNPNDPCYCAEDTLNYKYAISKEPASPTKNTDVEKANIIINLDKAGILDEIAEKNRDLIAQRLAEEKEVDEAVGDDRTSKIERLKKAIEKLESEDKK